MSYSTIYAMEHDASLMGRCSAGVASEVAATGVGDASGTNFWILNRSWDLAATPGWADAWESAVANDILDPGADEGVITDGIILARVQPLLAQYPLTPTT